LGAASDLPAIIGRFDANAVKRFRQLEKGQDKTEAKMYHISGPAGPGQAGDPFLKTSAGRTGVRPGGSSPPIGGLILVAAVTSKIGPGLPIRDWLGRAGR
jgi:hypothetical protein